MSNQTHIETDVELLARMRADDCVAFKTLYLRHWRYCYLQIYRRSGNHGLAEDLTQSVFVALWEKRKSAAITNLPAYLFAATRFKFVNYLKAQMHRKKYDTYAQLRGAVGQATTPETVMRAKELTQAIEKGVEMMPPKTRTIYTLSRTDHYSVKEIAGKLNLSEKAVEYHITQSLKTMRLALKDFLPLSVFFLFFL